MCRLHDADSEHVRWSVGRCWVSARWNGLELLEARWHSQFAEVSTLIWSLVSRNHGWTAGEHKAIILNYRSYEADRKRQRRRLSDAAEKKSAGKSMLCKANSIRSAFSS